MTSCIEIADCWLRTLSWRKEKTKHSLGQTFRRVGFVKATICQSSVHPHILQHPVIIVSSCHYVFTPKEWDSSLIFSAHSLPIYPGFVAITRKQPPKIFLMVILTWVKWVLKDPAEEGPCFMVQASWFSYRF